MVQKVKRLTIEQNDKPTEIEVISPSGLTKRIGIVKQDGLRKYLTKEEVTDILQKMPPGRDKMMLQVLWMTAIRVTELINIKKGDINFIKRRMTIRWQKSRRWRYRIIPVHPQLVDILQLFTAALNDSDRVFPYTRQLIFMVCKKYMACSPHKLRHSFAVNFLEQYKNPKALLVLKELLGHSRIETTMIYLKLVPTDMSNAIEQINFI